MWRKLRSACVRVWRASWAVLRFIARLVVTTLTVLFVGVAAAFGGRLRIEEPPPKNPVVRVEKKR